MQINPDICNPILVLSIMSLVTIGFIIGIYSVRNNKEELKIALKYGAVTLLIFAFNLWYIFVR